MFVELLSQEEAARRLAVSKATVRRLIRIGLLPAVRVGAQVRLRPEAIESYLSENAITKEKARG